MKKNKLTIFAFEKYHLTNANKITIKGGFPQDWNGTDELKDDIVQLEEEPDPNNGTGGPGSSTLSTGVIKPSVVDVIVVISIKP